MKNMLLKPAHGVWLVHIISEDGGGRVVCTCLGTLVLVRSQSEWVAQSP